MSATTTFIPWMLPLTYAAIIALQTQHIDPHLLLFVTVIWAILGTMTLRFWYQWLWPKIKKYVKIKKERTKDKDLDKSKKKQSWLKRKTHELHQKMHVLNKPHILFLTVLITTLLPIPDLVVIMHVQKKMNVLSFFIATVIGKVMNYVPIIYGIELGKMLLQYFQ